MITITIIIIIITIIIIQQKINTYNHSTCTCIFSFFIMQNPSITLVHYLDISASGTCRKVTPASLKRQLTDQVSPLY